MPTILIIDDEPAICDVLAEIIGRQRWQPVISNRLSEAHAIAAKMNVDVVLLDVRLPDGNGLHAISGFVHSPGKPEVIIITGQGCPDAASLALQYGAWDYIEKPLTVKQIILSVRRALEYRQAMMTAGKGRILKRSGIIGSSPAINECLAQLGIAADGDHNVLIYGETGTGKELFARAIHLNSTRRDKNLVAVDCATLTPGLIGSHLFGHVKGAFTDATRDQEGLISLADGGTLFLDEIGEIPLAMQKTFLRVLETRRFRPLGATKEIKSDFRLLAATNRNLEEMAAQGLFRNDLLYRLKSQELAIPPLRNRKEDIAELVNYYMAAFCQQAGIQPKICQPEFMQCLYNYSWPGNVRELINVLDMVVSTTKNDQILFHKHLPVNIRITMIDQPLKTKNIDLRQEGNPSLPAAGSGLVTLKAFRETAMQRMEKEYMVRLLEETQGDLTEMIRISGMGKSRIYELLEKHGLSPRKNRSLASTPNNPES